MSTCNSIPKDAIIRKRKRNLYVAAPHHYRLPNRTYAGIRAMRLMVVCAFPILYRRRSFRLDVKRAYAASCFDINPVRVSDQRFLDRPTLRLQRASDGIDNLVLR